MTIGEKIKHQRHLLGYTQVELANKVNISKQTLYKYENNIVTNIPSDKIELLANSLQVTPAYLMGWVNSPKQESLYNDDLISKANILLLKLNTKEKEQAISYMEFLLNSK